MSNTTQNQANNSDNEIVTNISPTKYPADEKLTVVKGLQFAIRSMQKTYKTGEPIDLEVRYVNKSNKRLDILPYFDEKYKRLSYMGLSVVSDKGVVLRDFDYVNPADEEDYYKFYRIALPSNSKWMCKYFLGHGLWRNSSLTVPGVYKIQIKAVIRSRYPDYKARLRKIEEETGDFPRYDKLYDDEDSWAGVILSNKIEVEVVK